MKTLSMLQYPAMLGYLMSFQTLKQSLRFLVETSLPTDIALTRLMSLQMVITD